MRDERRPRRIVNDPRWELRATTGREGSRSLGRMVLLALVLVIGLAGLVAWIVSNGPAGL